MARMPDGFVITLESDSKSTEVVIKLERELVMCKNCKHSYFASNRAPEEQCLVCGLNCIDITPDWFCADGERRE